MSIEQQLHLHFHKQAEKLKCTKEIDVQIQNIYQSHIHDHHIKKDKTSPRRISRLMIVAMVILLLCGFAYASTQLLFKTSEGSVNYEFYTDSTLTLQQISGNEIRESLDYVKQQLATGESAVVYLADYANEKHPFIKENPLLFVSNPFIDTNYDSWKATLEQSLPEYTLPTNLPDSITFVGGKKGYPIGNEITPDQKQLVEVLIKEAKDTGSKIVWQETSSSTSPITAFTTIYKNANDEEIYITMEIFPKDLVKVESYTNEAITHNQLDIHGKPAFYTNSMNFFSKTDYYQDLFWIKSNNDQTVVYRIGTESINLTQNELVYIANLMN